jgi:hypothetical protein
MLTGDSGMSTWLEFHIFTGVFGPFLVLLHSSWKFNGLAELVLLMTVLIVFSGFVGRYIYTAIPRSVDGVELEAGQIRSQIQAAEAEIVQYLQDSPQAGQAVQPLLAAAAPANTRPLALLDRLSLDKTTHPFHLVVGQAQNRPLA